MVESCFSIFISRFNFFWFGPWCLYATLGQPGSQAWLTDDMGDYIPSLSYAFENDYISDA